MVTVLGWLYLVTMVATPTVLVLLSLRGRRGLRRRQPASRLLTELYVIRRQLDVAVFKLEVWRAGTNARRQLEAELRELAQRERQS